MTSFINGTTWHQLTVVADGVNSTYYLDGAQVGSPVPSVCIGSIYSVGNHPPGAPQPFAAQIDEVYIYQRALSAGEVFGLYQGSSGSGVTANSIPDNSPVTISGGATLALQSAAETIGSLAGEAGTIVDLGPGTLTTGGNHGTTVFAGNLTGAGSLVKTGTGTMTLSGTNDFAGGTTVEAGTLAINSAAGLPAGGSLTIGAGGTVVLSSGLSVAGATSHAGSPTPVPEPDTLLLLGAGALAGLAAWWRTRRTKSGLHDNPLPPALSHGPGG